jgi:hypothetical protein
MTGIGLPVTYSRQAALALVAGNLSHGVVEKTLRRTLALWARYENVPLPNPLTTSNVKSYARTFRRHLGNPKPEELNVTCDLSEQPQ